MVLDQLIITHTIFFVLVITCLLDIVRKNYVFITHGSLRVNIIPLHAQALKFQIKRKSRKKDGREIGLKKITKNSKNSKSFLNPGHK